MPFPPAELDTAFWYQPKASRILAEQFLHTLTPGSFILRPSSKEGALALTHKLPSRVIGHALIYAKDGGGYFMEQKESAVFPTIAGLLKSFTGLDFEGAQPAKYEAFFGPRVSVAIPPVSPRPVTATPSPRPMRPAVSPSASRSPSTAGSAVGPRPTPQRTASPPTPTPAPTVSAAQPPPSSTVNPVSPAAAAAVAAAHPAGGGTSDFLVGQSGEMDKKRLRKFFGQSVYMTPDAIAKGGDVAVAKVGQPLSGPRFDASYTGPTGVQFELPRLQYAPGDVVRGSLILRLKGAKALKEVSLTFVGAEVTTKARKGHKHQLFRVKKFQVRPAAGERDVKMASGQYTYPFSFSTRSDLPATCFYSNVGGKGNGFRVIYELTCEVHFSRGRTRQLAQEIAIVRNKKKLELVTLDEAQAEFSKSRRDRATAPKEPKPPVGGATTAQAEIDAAVARFDADIREIRAELKRRELLEVSVTFDADIAAIKSELASRRPMSAEAHPLLRG